MVLTRSLAKIERAKRDAEFNQMFEQIIRAEQDAKRAELAKWANAEAKAKARRAAKLASAEARTEARRAATSAKNTSQAEACPASIH